VIERRRQTAVAPSSTGTGADDEPSVLVTEEAAFCAVGRIVVPDTRHVRVGSRVVVGSVVWLASRPVDVSSVRPPAVGLTFVAVVHLPRFALASERFRAASTRSIRDLVGAGGRGRSA
jgi:hypothetical protein